MKLKKLSFNTICFLIILFLSSCSLQEQETKQTPFDSIIQFKVDSTLKSNLKDYYLIKELNNENKEH